MKKILLGLTTVSMVGICAAAPQSLEENIETIIQGVNYVGVSVSDIEHSTEYYSAATDLQLLEENTIADNAALDIIAGREGVTAKSQLLRGANAQLRFMQFANPSAEALASSHVDVHGTGIVHICFQVADTTESYQRFLAGGAAPIGVREMVQLNPRNPVVYAYARDHDGIISEVEHIDFENLSRPKKHDYRIRHISLASPDIDRMVDFYSILMEQPDPRRLGPLAGEAFDKVSGYSGTSMQMAWFQTHNLELEVVEYMSHPPAQLSKPRPVDALGYNMIVFDVSNLDAARDRFRDAGGVVLTDTEPMDGGEIFFGRDPDGNLLGFQVVASDAVVSSKNFEDNGT